MDIEDQYLNEINTLVINSNQPRDEVAPISKITETIFLGQGRTTLYAGLLAKLGITHIVSVGRAPHGAVLNGPFTRLFIENLEDHDQVNIRDHFTRIFDFMIQAINQKGRIYIHCEMGYSRSPTVVIAFLRSICYCYSLQNAYETVKSKRFWISINLGFQEQLRQYFNESLEVN